MIEPDGSATVSTGPDGSQRPSRSAPTSSSVLEAELEAADLDAVEQIRRADRMRRLLSLRDLLRRDAPSPMTSRSAAAIGREPSSHTWADEHAPAHPVRPTQPPGALI